MLVRLGQHIGFVTYPLLNLTPLSTSRFPTALIAPSVLNSWSSVTMSSTFGFVGGGGVDGDDPAGANAEIDASATNAASSLRARIGDPPVGRLGIGRPTLSSRVGTVNATCEQGSRSRRGPRGPTDRASSPRPRAIGPEPPVVERDRDRGRPGARTADAAPRRPRRSGAERSDPSRRGAAASAP